MNMQLIQQIGKKSMKKVPDIRTGSTVKVHQRIKEGNKERIQIFEGLVIAVSASFGPNKTFTVRKVVGGIGVEKVFPLYSTNITKIQVTKTSDVRRSKLYYMRKRSGKSARLKEKHISEEKDVIEDVIEEPIVDEVVEAPVDAVVETAAAEVAPEVVAEEAPAEKA